MIVISVLIWMQGILYGSVGFMCGLVGQGIANLIMTVKRYILQALHLSILHDTAMFLTVMFFLSFACYFGSGNGLTACFFIWFLYCTCYELLPTDY